MSTPAKARGGKLEVTTVADDEIVCHVPARDGEPARVISLTGLEPDREHTIGTTRIRTLPRPHGARLATVATVNDLHFGEEECGRIHGRDDIGPVLRTEAGESPYPETMGKAIAAEIDAIVPDAVVAKGDLTGSGTPAEYASYRGVYHETFGERLFEVRGNHDAASGEVFAGTPFQEVALDGVILAIIDTTIPGLASGRVLPEVLEPLDELGARARRPVLVLGHHHPWDPGSRTRPQEYFGINPDDSEALAGVFARRPRLVAYAAGHTHRNRVRRFGATGAVPFVEVGAAKDYPGSWAEYRVFEGGILQVHRRASSPAALDWSERTRAMYGGRYADYAFGELEDRCFTVWEA